MDLTGVGKLLLVLAAVIALVGLVLLLAGRGLPGDLTFGRGNVRFLVPIGTSILISVLLTVILNLFLRR